MRVERLRLQDTWNRHPEIDEIKIEKPIVILGLPRSGTTHLLNLIAADKRLRSLPYWESLDPVELYERFAFYFDRFDVKKEHT